MKNRLGENIADKCILCPEVKVVARGLCHKCYQRLLWRKKNNPDTWPGWPTKRVRRGPRKRCDFCTRKHYAQGLCRNHYRQFGNRGLLGRRYEHSAFLVGRGLVKEGHDEVSS